MTTNSTEVKRHMIADEKFILLRQCQKEILEEIEFSPSLRKLANDLINDENLQQLKNKFINQWRKAE